MSVFPPTWCAAVGVGGTWFAPVTSPEGVKLLVAGVAGGVSGGVTGRGFAWVLALWVCMGECRNF